MNDGTIGSRVRELASAVRFGKFVSVGAVGAVFDNTVLTILQLGTALPTIVAKVAGIETAILVMFVVNERWTFRDDGEAGREPLLNRLLRSHLVRAGGSSLQLVVFGALYYRLDVSVPLFDVDVWFLVASVVAIGIAMLVNYCFESLFTWRVHRD